MENHQVRAYGAFIDGEFPSRDSIFDAPTFDARDAATGYLLARIARCGAVD